MESAIKGSLAIAAGAVVGALLRVGLQRAFNLSLAMPAGTLLVNGSGAFVMGFLAGLSQKGLSPVWFYGATAGLCGSFTTFSSDHA